MEKADKFSFIPGDSDDEIIEDEADDPEMRTVSIRHIGSCNRIRVCIVKREVFASDHTMVMMQMFSFSMAISYQISLLLTFNVYFSTHTSQANILLHLGQILVKFIFGILLISSVH